ncbi:MAG: flagellar protein FlaF [Hyphomicrobiales bacterium]|nr:flagellar protein FlaF [Hyphomicrobiales bacterium]
MQAAVRMNQARETGDKGAMLAAVRLNWQLWTIIQADLLAPDCQVELELRGNVLSLAKFIDKHTVQFLGDPQGDRLDVLININRELSAGMYTVPAGDGETEAAAQQPAAPAAEPGASAPGPKFEDTLA